MGRWQKLTLKNLIFGNFWGPEEVGSSLYQKNIGAKFTHLNRTSLCWEIVVDCHNLGHPNTYTYKNMGKNVQTSSVMCKHNRCHEERLSIQVLSQASNIAFLLDIAQMSDLDFGLIQQNISIKKASFQYQGRPLSFKSCKLWLNSYIFRIRITSN